MRMLCTGQDRLRGTVVDEHVGKSGLCVKPTVSLRTTFSHLRQMVHRGQSFQRSGAGGDVAGALAWAEGEDSSGHNTAFTR